MKTSWQSLYDEIFACEKCELCRRIHNKVPGQGDIHARLMFIGEGPGADEDMQGLAFVGAAGQLLTKMIAAMGMTREEFTSAILSSAVRRRIARPSPRRRGLPALSAPAGGAGAPAGDRAAGRDGRQNAAAAGFSHHPRARAVGGTQGRVVPAYLPPCRAIAR